MAFPPKKDSKNSDAKADKKLIQSELKKSSGNKAETSKKGNFPPKKGGFPFKAK